MNYVKDFKNFKRKNKDCFTPGFWDILPHLKSDADLHVVFGERTNGKTYSVLSLIIMTWLIYRRPSVYIRRIANTIRPKNLSKLFKEHIKMLGIDYNDIVLFRGGFYLAYRSVDTGELVKDTDPFMYTVALNEMEGSKGTFPDLNVAHVLFDEFLTRDRYLPNEFVAFANELSTVIRNTPDTMVWMLGNTVNWSCPYFNELGLTDVRKMTPGTIREYTIQNEDGIQLNVLVEYTPNDKRRAKKEANKWFAFNNPSLKMITSGKWELDMYPHPMFTDKQKTINRDIYVLFENDIICLETKYDPTYGVYILCRPYTRNEIDDRMIRVYTNETVLDGRYKNIIESNDKLDTFIWTKYNQNRFLYSDNTTGEIIRNFVNWVKTNKKRYQ